MKTMRIATRMRLHALVLVMTAGCTAPTPDKVDDDDGSSSSSSSSSSDSVSDTGLEMTDDTGGTTPFTGEHAAFEAMHARLRDGYAFTEWKAIDWDAHFDTYLPLIFDAEERGDPVAFGRALRQYGHSIPDAHIEVEGVGWCAEAEGGYGVVLSPLDDGTVAVVAVNGAKGVAPGDVVAEWNGVPIDEALADAPSWCGFSGLATPEQLQYEQLRWLVRGVPGSTVAVTLDSGLEVEVVAEDDERWSLEATGPRDWGAAVTWSLLDDGVGYIHISHVDNGQVREGVIVALTTLLDAGADKLVLDVRDNDGGYDELAATIAGHFHQEELFYETTTWWDDSKGYDTPDEVVFVQPQLPQWTQPVAVLVNHFTISSGEGIALAVGWSPQATIIGFEPTAASFGMTGGQVGIDEGVGEGATIWFPLGKSLDENGVVQLDSNHLGEGGVHPDLRVPWTLENRTAWATGGDPELDFAVSFLLDD